MSTIGTVGVRVIPNLTGFGATVAAGVAGSGSVMARAGASAALLISAPLVAGVAKGISEAVSFESAMAGVAKTVDAPREVIDKIGVSIRNMAKEMPFAREELARVAEAVGRFGVQAKDIPKVTEMFTKLGVAIPEMDTVTSAEQMTRFFTVMNTPVDGWERNLDALVELGNGLATSEQMIISFASRLAQISAVSNVTEADVLGLAAGFSVLGIQPQAGASSIARVFFEMDEAVKGSKENMDIFTQTMGLTEDQFRSLWDQDPASLFLSFVDALKKANDAGIPITGILADLGINDIRVRRTLLAGVNNPEKLREALALANDAASEGGALQEEYGKRLETTASQWILLKNKASDAALVFGTAMLPILLDLFSAMEPIIELISLMAAGFSSLPEGARQFLAMLGLILITLGPTVFLIMKVIPLIGALRAALALLAASPVVLILMAIALAALLIIMHWDTLKSWFFAFWEWFYTNWDELYAWFIGRLNDLEAWWTQTWESIASFFYGKYIAIRGWWDGLIAKIAEIIEAFVNLRNNFGMAWDWIVQKASQAKDTLIGIMNEIKQAARDALGPLGDIISVGGGIIQGVARTAMNVRGMDNGGIVPGPIGAPRMILAHGGEEVRPRHKDGSNSGTVININMGNVSIRDDRDIVALGRELARETDRVKAAKVGRGN